jgi:hypothetical protein
MQGPTHLVTGVLIQKALRKVRFLPLQYFLVAFLAIISHGILDRLTRFTYHSPNPLIGDWFWISYHVTIVFLTTYIFIRYWRKYKVGLIFSVLPDFDWVVIHSSNFFSFQIPFWKEAILHKFFFSFLDSLPPFIFLNNLPDWGLKRKGVILEFAILAILITLIILAEKNGKKGTEHIQVSNKTDRVIPESIIKQQVKQTWKDWIGEVEKGKLIGFWSLGTKWSQLIAGIIAFLIIVTLFFIEKHLAWLLLISLILISGIIWLLHSSWLWREAWKLKEKRREIEDQKSREDISMAIEYLEGHRDVDKIWGWVLIVIAGWMFALRRDIEIFGKVLLLLGFIIALIFVINIIFFLRKK